MSFASIGAGPGPVTVTGIYGFDEGNAALIEAMVNTFAGLVGFTKVPQDGFIDTTDADRMVRVQRFIFENYICKSDARKAAVDKLEGDLDAAGVLAMEERGATVTPEQMWVSRNQDGIISKMPTIHHRISSGELKRCAAKSLVTTQNLVIGLVVVGGILWWGKGKK